MTSIEEATALSGTLDTVLEVPGDPPLVKDRTSTEKTSALPSIKALRLNQDSALQTLD